LLFFNPCAQLISKLINEERENSCDDLVVSTTSNPLTYAKALLKLEQTNEKNLQLAMSATGKKYYLLNRIERIMKTKKQNQSIRPALLALVILTMGIGSIALLNPEIAQGKISVKAPIHAIINNLLTDTTRKTKKTTTYKKAYKAKANVKYNNDHKFNYAYNNGDTWDFHDAELDRLSREVEKYGEAIGKYYESGDYKKQTEALEEKGREMEAFYNKPELKRLQEEMEKAGEEFQKNYGETSETKETSKKMEELGKKIETYYNSTEFKKINEALEKKYGIPHEHNYRDDKDENYRKYQAELKTQIPAEVTQYNVELKELGKKLRAHFNSAGYREHSERLRALGDSLRRAFRNPGMEQQKAEMQALSRKVRDYSHNPEIKKQQELLRQATAKMRAYMNTPDFKRRLEEYKKDRRAHGWDGDDNDHDSSDAVSDTTKNN
jgi:bla regulator protein BlaR1